MKVNIRIKMKTKLKWILSTKGAWKHITKENVKGTIQRDKKGIYWITQLGDLCKKNIHKHWLAGNRY